MFYRCTKCGCNVGITTVICPKCNRKDSFKLTNVPIKQEKRRETFSDPFFKKLQERHR